MRSDAQISRAQLAVRVGVACCRSCRSAMSKPAKSRWCASLMSAISCLFAAALLAGAHHDRRAVRVVGADVDGAVAAQLLEAHPDVGLDVLDQMAQVDVPVGVGQRARDQDFRHLYPDASVERLPVENVAGNRPKIRTMKVSAWRGPRRILFRRGEARRAAPRLGHFHGARKRGPAADVPHDLFHEPLVVRLTIRGDLPHRSAAACSCGAPRRSRRSPVPPPVHCACPR